MTARGDRGVFIAGIGLPGCGKSAVFRRAAELLPNAVSFLEPEEKCWPDAVNKRDAVGHITGVHWFRSIRVPKLYAARQQADQGCIALMDSFYDKLCSYYLGKPGMEWLIDPQDPYFANVLEMARLDLRHLPEADAVVAVEVGESDWSHMLAARNRDLDRNTELQKTFPTQAYFMEAARQYCAEKGVKLVSFKNTYSTLDESAGRLIDRLRSDQII